MPVNIDLRLGDCLELMRQMPDKSIDLIVTDPPYGITGLSWDKPILLEPLWDCYKRVIKDNGAILLFSVMPFGADLITSNRKMFRYEIIWHKTHPTNFLNAQKMPLRAHENILVFYKKLPTYNPQKTPGKRYKIAKGANPQWSIYRGCQNPENVEHEGRYPVDVIKISNPTGAIFGDCKDVVKHGTSKPVEVLEYLINTYSNAGDVVLDSCMGSGSTGVACVNTGRNFIGCEIDPGYYELAKKRLEAVQEPLCYV